MLMEFLNSDTKAEVDAGAMAALLDLPAGAEVATSFDEYAKQTYDGVMGASPANKGISHLRQWELIVADGWVLSSPQGGGLKKFSYVDLALWMFTDQLGAEWLESHGFTALAKHHTSVEALPAIAAYLKSTRIMPAFKEDDYSYLEDKWVSAPK
eukprot:gnl/MRDRNA2_/MRDRNA2_275059_c0_seq1.p1 gnl/MRDRNA2_/MRDRNA2_275059_c0~~gnl/MRDRNA2_/MRDRNA2_275059_c0_seq1.p1  ORF type:complete len:154 (-),score=30.63 gnl/MRDRNA2_/MRDRNA2_275059_c0_seq1:147-608(-)